MIVILPALLPPLPLLWDESLVEDYQAGCKCYFPLRNVSTPIRYVQIFFFTLRDKISKRIVLTQLLLFLENLAVLVLLCGRDYTSNSHCHHLDHNGASFCHAEDEQVS